MRKDKCEGERETLQESEGEGYQEYGPLKRKLYVSAGIKECGRKNGNGALFGFTDLVSEKEEQV